MSAGEDSRALLADPPAKEVAGPVCAAEGGRAEQPVTTNATHAGLCLGDSPGIYTSVLVAAFGGVSVELSKGKRQVHPIWMLLLALPLFVVQVSTILILRSGLDIDRPVYTRGDSQSAALLTLKLALVAVVYLTNFKPFIYFAERLVFVSNPITWAEVKHYDVKQSAFLYRLPSQVGLATIIPCAFCSIFMYFVVSYLVCIDSVSIIFSADSAQDSIFNSLAIGFVLDLAESWWAFVQHNFHLNRIDEFEFELQPRKGTWTDGGELILGPETMWSSGYHWLVRATTWRTLRMRSSFLRVGFGVRRLQTILSLLLLCVIYTRQLLVVLYAIRTNVLPAARDMCEELVLSKGTSVPSKMWDIFQSHMMVSMDVELNYTLSTTKLKEKCLQGDDYQRMELHHMQKVLHDDWFKILVCLMLMLFVIVLPSAAIAVQGLLEPDDTDQIDQEQTEDINTLKKDMGSMKDAIRKLKEDIQNLKG